MEQSDKKIQTFAFLNFNLDLMLRDTKQESELTPYYIGWNGNFWTNLIPTDETNTRFVFFKAGFYALYDSKENKAMELTRTAYLNFKKKKEVRVSSQKEEPEGRKANSEGRNTNFPKKTPTNESLRLRKGFKAYYAEAIRQNRGGKRS